MIGIIDYGMGNIRSVENALDHLELEHILSSDPAILEQCDRLILPGVGAIKDCMENLEKTGLKAWLQDYIPRSRTPILGICLGMQAFFAHSEENGGIDCLGLLEGNVVQMTDPNVRIPHIGWNQLHICPDSRLKEKLPEDPYVYYDHSYYAVDVPEDTILGTSGHGPYTITGMAGKDNILACQFHPEKSGQTGLKILEYFGKEL